MAVSATAKSLINADSYSTKWHTKRIHRKLDDRDDVLDEALQIIESHDTGALPFVQTMLPSVAPATWTSVGSSASFTLTFAIGGAGCTSASTVTCVIGEETIAGGSVVPTADTVTVTISAGLDGFSATPTANMVVPIYLRIDGVLCPVIAFTALA